MAANIRGFTSNYAFKLINFDTPRWHTLEYSNWQLIDALLAESGLAPVRGEWMNSTSYLAGERVYDDVDGFVYRAIVSHVSSDSETAPTFAIERANNPHYWQQVSLKTPFYRGTWANGTYYSVGDMINVGDVAFYLCVITHTSPALPAAFNPDPYWQVIFDTSTTIDMVEDSEEAAAASASAASTSATNAATSASQAAGSAAAANTSANNSASSASAAATSATNAATSESNAATSATNAQTSYEATITHASAAAGSAQDAAESAAIAANQAATLQGTSTTEHTVGLGIKVFTTQQGKQFNPGNFVLVTSALQPVAHWMLGQVLSYVPLAGTDASLSLNIVAASTTAATVNDWKLYISGTTGPAGMRWKGTWSAAEPYGLSDAVLAPNGSSYICIQPHTNQQPPNATYWNLLAQGGSIAIAPDSVVPSMLDAGTQAKQLAFRDRLNFVSRDGDTITGALTVRGNGSINPLMLSNGWSGSASNNVQIRIHGGLADADLWAFGTDVATGTGTKDFHFYALGSPTAVHLALQHSTGNVALGGEITPAARLHVRAAGVGNQSILLLQKSDTNGVLDVYTGGSGEGILRMWDQGGNQRVNFNTAGDSYFTGGNVGIGTTTPVAKLAINTGTAYTNPATAFIAAGSALLGSTLDAVDYVAEFRGSNGNAARLGFMQHRAQAGSAWDTAAWRIQPFVDNSFTGASANAGYITFLYGGSLTVKGIGIGTTGATTPDFMFTIGGYMGIGTANPLSKLAVLHNNRGIEVIPNYGAPHGNIIQSNSRASGFAYDDLSFIAMATRFCVGGTEYMRLHNNGNVGIGTTNPTEKLQVTGGQVAINNGAGTPAAIKMISARDYQIFSHTDSKLHFWDNAAGAFRMTIDSAGNVGIGTASPGKKLEVAGTGSFSSTLFITGGEMYVYGYVGNNNMSVIRLNNAGDRYLHYDGANYVMPGAHIWGAAGRLWGTNDGTPIMSGGGFSLGSGTVGGTLYVHSGNNTMVMLFGTSQNHGLHTNGDGNLYFMPAGGPWSPIYHANNLAINNYVASVRVAFAADMGSIVGHNEYAAHAYMGGVNLGGTGGVGAQRWKWVQMYTPAGGWVTCGT